MNTLLKKLVQKASASKDALLEKVVDDWIFPWFEAKTGKHSSNKVMRKQVAEQVEKSLSKTLWSTKEDAAELDEDGLNEEDYSTLTPLFVVLSVFPQSRSGGTYELMVSVIQKDAPVNAQTITLETFMQNFIPRAMIDFQDLNS